VKANLIQGISHITFIVSDLEKMSNLLEFVFGAKEVYFSSEATFSISKEKFFIINNLWIAIMEGTPLPEKTYNHIAFKIQEKDLDEYLEKVKAIGLEVREARSRVPGEGQSLYFYDYDNHLFELHTGTLDQRLESYLRANVHVDIKK
jgi:fosfomycin resistance protein FosX